MSINRGVMKKIWYMHTAEYFSALKRTGGGEPVTCCNMDYKDIMLSKINQLRKDEYSITFM